MKPKPMVSFLSQTSILVGRERSQCRMDMLPSGINLAGDILLCLQVNTSTYATITRSFALSLTGISLLISKRKI